MLTATLIVVTVLGLAFSRLGKIRLGGDDERPEFSTISWLTMLFAAGMGVGLLFYGSAEPLTHYGMLSENLSSPVASEDALIITNFNWALHAWCIYAVTALGAMGSGIRSFTFENPLAAVFLCRKFQCLTP